MTLMGSKPRAVGEARWSAAELLTPLLACAFALGLVLAAWCATAGSSPAAHRSGRCRIRDS